MNTRSRVLVLLVVGLSGRMALAADAPQEVTDAAATIPGLNLLARAAGIETAPQGVGYRLKDTTLGEASVFKAADGKWRGALVLKTPGALTLPGFEAAGTLSLKGVTFIFSDSAATLTVAELPQSVTYSPAFSMEMVNLKPGVNVFLAATVSGGMFGQLQSALGASGDVYVSGVFGEAVVKKLLGQPSADDVQASLTVTFTPGRLPMFAAAWNAGVRVFDGSIDRVSLTATRTAAGVSFGGDLKGVSLKIMNGNTGKFDGSVIFTRTGTTNTIELKAEKAFTRSLGVPGVSLTTIGVAAKLSSAPGAKAGTLAVTASVSLPGEGSVSGVLLLNTKGTGTFVLDVSGLDIGGLVGLTLPFPLNLPKAVVVVSTGDAGEQAVSALPSQAADMLTGLGLKATSKVRFPTGLAFYAQLKVGNGAASAEMQKLSKVGANFDLIIGGSVALSATPSFNLTATLPGMPKVPDPIGKFMRFNDVGLFLSLSVDGGIPVVGAGLEGGLRLNLPTSATTLAWVDFGGKASFSFGGTAGGALQVKAQLESDWNSAFALQGVAFLKDTGVSFQADASGAVRVLLDGQARFEDGAANNTSDDLVFKMGGAISVLFSTGIPSIKGLAMRIEASEVALLTPVKVGQVVLRSAAGLASSLTDASGVAIPQVAKDALNTAKNANLVGLIQGLIPNVSPLKELVAFKLKGNPGVAGSTVLFFLATPGMSDPDFPDFNDAGVKVRGSLYLGDKYLAGTDSYLTLNDGFQLQASVADFSIGPLALSNAAIDIGAGIPVLQPNALARFKVSGKATLGGVTLASVDVNLSPSKIAAAGEVNIGLCPNKIVSAPLPGALVALYSPSNQRVLRVEPNGALNAGNLANPLELQESWTWERFRVLPGPGGTIGLYNETNNRMLTMASSGQMEGVVGMRPLQPPFLFKIVPGPRTGSPNLLGLYSPSARRFLRITNGGGVDGNGAVIPSGLLPPAWDWERLQIIQVSPGAQASCGSWGLSARLEGSINSLTSFSIKGRGRLVLPKIGFVELPALDTGEFKLETPDGIGFSQSVTWEKASFGVSGKFKSLTDWSLDGTASADTGKKEFKIGDWKVASIDFTSGSLSISMGPGRFRVHAKAKATLKIHDQLAGVIKGRSWSVDFDTDLPSDLRLRMTLTGVPDPEARCATAWDEPCPTLKEPWAWCHRTGTKACPFEKNRNLDIDYRIFP